jgi:hypothetical protein
MPQAVDSNLVVEQFAQRLHDLEVRVAALESARIVMTQGGASRKERIQRDPSEVEELVPGALPQIQRPRPPATWRGFPPIETSGIFSTLGRAILGFAGAFLLRAIAESGSVSKLPVLMLAILYACFWMVWGTRTINRFASAIYAVTSVTILSPLLWEATVRFQTISASVSAAVLVSFVILTLALAAGHAQQLIPWIAILSMVSTTIALIVETHELVPLTAALLAVAAATEVSVSRGHQLTFRGIPAIAADFSVWSLIYILASDSVPEGYRAAPAATMILFCGILPGVYGASITLRSFVQLHPVTVFETAQAVASFVLATYGILRVSHNSDAPALGILFLLLSAVCYWGTLARFAPAPHTRNRRVSATCAAALLLAGTLLLFPVSLQVPFLCIAALLAAILYTRTAKLSLGLHASFYIASAAAVSPFVGYVSSALAGTVPAAPDLQTSIVSLAAALCYGIESRNSVDEGRRRLLWIVPASVVAFTIAAWAITAIVRLTAGRLELAASNLSMIRTIVICLLALALGLASRRRHIELRWIAYGAVALGTLKLLFEDLRFGNPASLVVSFVFYGLILILLPRLTRAKPSK